MLLQTHTCTYTYHHYTFNLNIGSHNMTKQTKVNIVEAVEQQTSERVMIIFPDGTADSTNKPTLTEFLDNIQKEIGIK